MSKEMMNDWNKDGKIDPSEDFLTYNIIFDEDNTKTIRKTEEKNLKSGENKNSSGCSIYLLAIFIMIFLSQIL